MLRVQAPKNVYPNFHPSLPGHQVDKFGKVIPIDDEVSRLNTLNCATIFEFLFPQHFCGAPYFWAYHISLKLHLFPIIWQSFAAIGRGLEDFAHKPIAPNIVVGEAPDFGTYIV